MESFIFISLASRILFVPLAHTFTSSTIYRVQLVFITQTCKNHAIHKKNKRINVINKCNGAGIPQ